MSKTTPPDNLPLAVATILATVFAMAAGDGLVKKLGTQSELGVWQLFLIRSLMVLPVLGIGAIFLGGLRTFAPAAAGWVTLRAALLVGVWIAYYTALPHIPLSAAAAALYTLPLFIVGLSALFTDDTVTPMHGVAALIGFAGVALVLRPGTEAFSPYAALPILAAILFATAMVLSRLHCRHDHPLALVGILHLAFIVAGAAGVLIVAALPELAGSAFLAKPWVPLTAGEWQLTALLALSILIASVGTAIAYQKAPGSIVGTLEFAYVGFAVFWGFVLFEEWPDALSFIGLALIVLSGALAIRRPGS